MLIGDILLARKTITKRQLEKALAIQGKIPELKTGEILVKMKACTIFDVVDAVQEQGGRRAGDQGLKAAMDSYASAIDKMEACSKRSTLVRSRLSNAGADWDETIEGTDAHG